MNSRGIIRRLQRDGCVEVAVPSATAPEKIRATRGSIEVARFLVRGEAPRKSVRLNISLDKALIAKIDRAARTRSMTRSGFIAQAATQVVEDTD
jgi:HicB-like antitoxin of HicAB toxin-antitoxin system